MSDSPAEVVQGMYDAFARADIGAILNALDEQIDWRVPENVPHGGRFSGREGVGRFFQGIGENWDGLTVEVDRVLEDGDHAVALVSARGRLRATGQETGYTAAHAWTLRDGTAIKFAEPVDAPVSLPGAAAA